MSFDYKFTGTLNVSADGKKGTGMSFVERPVYIVREENSYEYPILIGDKYTDKLGWVKRSDLTYVGSQTNGNGPKVKEYIYREYY